jgi:hypothetical protein
MSAFLLWVCLLATWVCLHSSKAKSLRLPTAQFLVYLYLICTPLLPHLLLPGEPAVC